MFHRILIANRGEIALRIVRACHELGIEAVAVYSTVDRECLHVQAADHAVCIGPPPARHSYLSTSNVLAAAKITGCQAVHPGYGFLAENSGFARACQDQDLTFIGQPRTVWKNLETRPWPRGSWRRAGFPRYPVATGSWTPLPMQNPLQMSTVIQ